MKGSALFKPCSPRFIALALVVMFAVIGCGSTRPSIQVNEDAVQTVSEVTAFMLGYVGAQRYPAQFGLVELVGSTMLQDEMPLQEIVDTVIGELGIVIEDPVLKKQGEKLLSIFDLEIVDGTIPVEGREKIIRASLNEFLDGIRAAQGQEV